jgi:hypothetical protein
MTFYVIVKDAKELLGDARKLRFYACWPFDMPRARWSWTCAQDAAFLFTSREEAARIAHAHLIGPKTVGVRVIKFRERLAPQCSCAPRDDGMITPGRRARLTARAFPV